MDTLEKIEIVKKTVIDHFKNTAEYTEISNLSQTEIDHIINIGTSVLCTKWKVGYEGGGFVKSFVNNDLLGAIGSADRTTYKGFKFFASLIYNVGKPYSLEN
jgi:hypothetical protein